LIGIDKIVSVGFQNTRKNKYINFCVSSKLRLSIDWHQIKFILTSHKNSFCVSET